jgi:hypothetical protein
MRLLNLAPIAALVSAQTGRYAETEVPLIRTYFYVGGGYSDDGNGGHIFKDHMYVEKLIPLCWVHCLHYRSNIPGTIRVGPSCWCIGAINIFRRAHSTALYCAAKIRSLAPSEIS